MIRKFLEKLSGGERVRAEKARLEAFLSAFPGAYCGFNPDGTIAYSPDFPDMLGIGAVHCLQDVQNALQPGDAAALESCFARLRDDGKAFTLIAQKPIQDRIFKISGSKGEDLGHADRFDILWIEDVTDHQLQYEQMREARDMAEEDLKCMRAALDVIPMPVWMRNTRTELTWCNLDYAEVLETSPATVIAEQKELPPTRNPGKKDKQARNLRAMSAMALETGQAQTTQRHIILGGHRRLMELREIPLLELDVTVGLARDITREEELESEQKRHISAHHELLEQLRTAICIFDADQRLEFYNSAFAQLWGLNEQWLNTRPRLSEIMEKLRETRRLPEQADFRKFKQDWLDMFTSLIDPHDDMLYLPDGSALRQLVIPHPMGGLMMTFEDVTSRLELESSYNTLIAVQKETLDNLTEGVAVYGGDGRLKLWNPAFANLWSLNPEDLEGEPHVSAIVERMKARFDTKDWQETEDVLKAQALAREIEEGHFARGDGTIVEYSTVPLPDGGVLVTHVDITDTVNVENALREKNAALQAAEALKMDFLANVSYQLRTPLNAIMGFTDILANEYFGKLNDRQKEYTNGMQEAGERLLGLINDILDLSTIEAGYLTLNPEDLDVGRTLLSIYDLTREWARKEDIEVLLECSEDLGRIEADERRLKQSLLNLIRNAIAFTPKDGTITLSAHPVKEGVRIDVRDTGKGIPPEDQQRIFAPFERIRPTRGEQDSGIGIRPVEAAGAEGETGQTTRGAGLGLSLVKNIIELHGGAVALESRPGIGTTISLTLPRAIPEQSEDTHLLERQAEGTA